MSRSYPERPIFGVGAIVFKDGAVLLIQRGREPGQGKWSLPGGAQKLGEKAETTLIREVAEETGLTVRPIKFLKLIDIIEKDSSGAISYHYTVADYVAEVTGGTLKAGSDAKDARFVALADLGKYELTPLVKGVIEAAWKH